MDDEFIEHYGVKGMRWGKRKAAQAKDAVSRIDLSGKFKKPTPEQTAKARRVTTYVLKKAVGKQIIKSVKKDVRRVRQAASVPVRAANRLKR